MSSVSLLKQQCYPMAPHQRRAASGGQQQLPGSAGGGGQNQRGLFQGALPVGGGPGGGGLYPGFDHIKAVDAPPGDHARQPACGSEEAISRPFTAEAVVHCHASLLRPIADPNGESSGAGRRPAAPAAQSVNGLPPLRARLPGSISSRHTCGTSSSTTAASLTPSALSLFRSQPKHAGGWRIAGQYVHCTPSHPHAFQGVKRSALR